MSVFVCVEWIASQTCTNKNANITYLMNFKVQGKTFPGGTMKMGKLLIQMLSASLIVARSRPAFYTTYNHNHQLERRR